MSKKEGLIYGAIASAISAVMLMYALGDQQYGYYQTLRFVVFIAGALTAYIAYRYTSHIVVTLSVIAAILFNPIAQVTFEKSTWQSIDVVTAIYFFVVAIVFVSEIYAPSSKK